MSRTRTAMAIGAVVIAVAAIGAWYMMRGSGPTQKEPYHIGIISGVAIFDSMADGFRQKMTELRYEEGRDVTYDVQKRNADPVGVETVVRQFVADRVDMILAFPTEPASAAKAAAQGTSIPVVFALGTLEGSALVQNVNAPGDNITGVRYPNPELTVRRFEILHRLKPGIRKLLIAFDPEYPAVPSALSALRPAATAAGVTLVEERVKNVGELEHALAAHEKGAKTDIDAVLIMPELTVQSPDGWPMMVAFAKKHAIPIGGSAAFEADAGAVFSYIPDNIENGRQAAILADKILRGTPAGTIPVVTPESYLRLNVGLATSLGLNVDDGLLALANEIIR